jgi:hypothetical protein
VADEYVKTRVIGIDISPIQPTLVPLNCEFMLGDFREDLTEFPSGYMDLIHARCPPMTFGPNSNTRAINAGLKKSQWPEFVCEVFRILKPGTGWVVLGGIAGPTCDDGSVPEDSLYCQVCFGPIISVNYLVPGNVDKDVGRTKNSTWGGTF